MDEEQFEQQQLDYARFVATSMVLEATVQTLTEIAPESALMFRARIEGYLEAADRMQLPPATRELLRRYQRVAAGET